MATPVLGAFQQTASAVGLTNTSCFEMTDRCFAIYAFEYKPGFDNAYITWINQVKAWTVFAEAFKPDSATEVSNRPVPEEPMVCFSASLSCAWIWRIFLALAVHHRQLGHGAAIWNDWYWHRHGLPRNYGSWLHSSVSAQKSNKRRVRSKGFPDKGIHWNVRKPFFACFYFGCRTDAFLMHPSDIRKRIPIPTLPHGKIMVNHGRRIGWQPAVVAKHKRFNISICM